MLSSKTKTGLSEAIPNKTTPATPRGGKLAKGATKSSPDSPSPQPNSRLSIDRSPRVPESKPAVDRRSPRTTVTPDKPQPRTSTKGSELQAQLNQIQEDLKKAKEQLAAVEKEKEKALEELKEAKKLAEDASDKVGAALVAQKRAEEITEIEKFRADELEQAGIERAQKREEEWRKEIDDVRNQHAADVSALLSTTEELQKMKHELAMTSDAKNQALDHADDATKIAEIHAEKVELLSAELCRVKALLDSNQDNKTSESSELLKELSAEMGFLKQELEKAKAAETEKAEAESMIEQLKHELEKAKAAETKMVEAETSIEELKQELQGAKAFEAKMVEAETMAGQLKQELQRAKAFEAKVAEAETSIEQLKEELQRAKAFETKMAEAEASVEQLKLELEKAKAAEIKMAEAAIFIERLKQELEEAKVVNAKMSEAETVIEKLKHEVEISKRAESDALILVEELRVKAEHLENQVYEANQLERSASESLATLMEQLEGKSGLLQDAEAEVTSLRGKVESLEISVGRQKKDLEESNEHLSEAKQEATEKARMVESLISELETVKEEKVQALNNEKLAASSVQSLLEEKNKLINELDTSRDEEDKSKKAMESLASALHEVSTEVRETKEKLLSAENQLGNAEAEMKDLKLVLEATNEKYEALLDEAKHENNLLTDNIGKSKHEIEDLKATWEQKELNFVNSTKKFEEESSYLKNESDRLAVSLKKAEEEVQFVKEEGSGLQDALKEAETEVVLLQGVVGEVKRESMMLKERLLDRENELQHITQENDELRLKEATALEKVKELSKLLEEALAKKENVEDGELSNSEKDYDMLPSVVEFSEENGVVREEPKSIVEIPSQAVNEPQAEKEKDHSQDLVESVEPKMENGNGNCKQEGTDSTVEVVEAKMWESCKIGDKDLLPEKEPEPESFEGEVDSKADDESFDNLNGLSSTENIENGVTSPTKQQLHKKKKPLLHKFGSLLKKGSTKSK